MKLGASMIIHNAVEFDYCVEESIRSLMPVVDELVVLDAESTDGTLGLLSRLAREYGKIKIATAPWKPNPGGWGSWLSDLSNFAKSHLKDCTHHVALQADEVLGDCHPEQFRHYIAAHPCVLHRLNFWIDHKHLVPPGRVCSDKVIRASVIQDPYVGDAESLLPSSREYLIAAPRIYHYGMIRRTKAFVAKSKPMHRAFTGGPHDPALDIMEHDPKIGFERNVRLADCHLFNGGHPEVAHRWLRERGYSV